MMARLARRRHASTPAVGPREMWLREMWREMWTRAKTRRAVVRDDPSVDAGRETGGGGDEDEEEADGLNQARRPKTTTRRAASAERKATATTTRRRRKRRAASAGRTAVTTMATRRKKRATSAEREATATTMRARAAATTVSVGVPPTTTRGPAKRRRVEKASATETDLLDDVWMIICEKVNREVDEDKKTRTNRAGVVVDKRREVYKKRLDCLLAMRQTCSQLRRVLSGEFGEELFRHSFEQLAEFTDAAWGESDAPATMLWRHKAWYLTELGCQGCDKHATVRKPNWTFGVRMCKECLMKRTVCDYELKRDEEWSKHGTYEELTVGLPSDKVHGWSRLSKESYTMTRFWKNSVKKRIALLKRAKTPAERAEICAPPKPREDSHSFEKNARKRRKEELKAELALVGCEMRGDSKLSKLFIDGFPKSRRDRERWTANAVARRMAEMKYIHEYCAEFRNIIDGWRQDIDELHDEGWGFHAEITEEVTGFRNFGAAVRDLADGWSDFPARWPWLADPAA